METVTANPKRHTPWAAAVASVLFAWLQWPLLKIYGWVHWGALFTPGREIKLPDTVKASLFEVLHTLDIYRIVIGVAGVAFAIWALLSKPRWIGAVALVASAVGCFFSLVQM